MAKRRLSDGTLHVAQRKGLKWPGSFHQVPLVLLHKPVQAKCVLPSPPACQTSDFFQPAQALISETPLVRACESMGRAGGSGAAAGIRHSAGNQKPTARVETGTDRVLGCLGGDGLYRLWLLFITHKSFAFY